MKARHRLRAILALLTAYTVACPAILLGTGCGPTGGNAFAAEPICGHGAVRHPIPAPAAPCWGCVAACAADCCAAALSVPMAAAVPRDRTPAALAGMPDFAMRSGPATPAAHRSRAPPA
jgi:hypothetical protein